jgi:WD40 repeat protein
MAAGQTRTGAKSTVSDDIVFAISFSPDGRTLAIARGASEPVQRFGRIELWDTETLELRHIIKGFDGPVESISFSPDGHTLISGSTEFRPKLQQEARSREGTTSGELKWWDTRTGELKQKLTISIRDRYSIRAIQSPDGKQLAVAQTPWLPSQFFPFRIVGTPVFSRIDPTFDALAHFPRPFLQTEMKLVDMQSGTLRFKWDIDEAGAAIFSPDGSLLAAPSGQQVKLWNPQTGKEVRKLKNIRGAAIAVAFSPDSETLAVASTKYEREYEKKLIKIIGISEVTLFEVRTGKVIHKLSDVGAVNTLAFSPDGKTLVVGGVLPRASGESAGLKFFDFRTGKVRDLPTGADYNEAVESIVLSSNGRLLAFRAGSATVKLLDTQKGTITQTWDADSVRDAVERPASRFLVSVERVLAVSFSADGTTVYGESDQGEIKSWDQRTGEVKRHLSLAEDDPSLVAAATNGKSFAEVSQGKLFLWDAKSDTKRTVPLWCSQAVSALALSANGQLLAVACGSEVSMLSGTGEVNKKLKAPEGLVSRLAFSNDGRTIAAADEEGVIRIWNVASGSIEKILTGSGEITALVFAPNGETLATAAADNTISLWNLQTGLAPPRFHKHDATINALAFSPNGQLLASGGDDRTIVLWEVSSGNSKRTFKGHDQTVASLAFSPDGQLLASGSGNAAVVLWEVGTGKLSRVLR